MTASTAHYHVAFTCPDLVDSLSADDLTIQFLAADPLLLLDIYNTTVPPGILVPLFDLALDAAALAAQEAIVLLPNPGAYPIQAPNAGNPGFQIEQSTYVFELSAYKEQTRILADIKAKLVSMLPVDIRARLLPMTPATMVLSPQATYRLIKTFFLQATPSTLASLQRQLLQPFQYTSVHSLNGFFAKHEQIQRNLLQLNFASSMPLQVQAVRVALHASPDADVFAAAFDHFDITNPDPSTHILANFITTCRSATAKLDAKHVDATAVSPYAANAAAAKQPNNPRPNNPNKESLHCNSHGPNDTHVGAKCKYPHALHNTYSREGHKKKETRELRQAQAASLTK